MKLSVTFHEQNESFGGLEESDELIDVGFGTPQDNTDSIHVDFSAVQTRTVNGSGVSDYNQLTNRPRINQHLLRGGENTLAQLGIGLSSNTAINRLFS